MLNSQNVSVNSFIIANSNLVISSASNTATFSVVVSGVENENNIAESGFFTVTSYYSESIEKYSVDYTENFVTANTL